MKPPVAAPGRGAAVEIGSWRPGDEHSICRLFARTFGRGKSVEHWRWQFLGQGGEPHVSVARDGRGEVVAHFGGVARRMQVGGRPRLFVVAVDSMVARDRRAGLQRHGLFAAVAEHWVDQLCARGGVGVGYGLPNREAYRLGHRLLDYTALGEIVVQVAAVGSAPHPAPGAADGDVAVTRSTQPEPDHDELWTRCRGRFAVSAVRDRAFLAWRWAACPGAEARFLAVRRRGRLCAVAVYRPAWTERGCASLADLLWDGRHEGTLQACLAGAGEEARADGCAHLVALLPEGSAEAAVLQRSGFRAARTAHPFVARSFDAALELPWLAKRWYFTAADFDLV